MELSMLYQPKLERLAARPILVVQLQLHDCRQKIKLIKLPTKGDEEQDKMKESRVDEGETVALARCQPVLAAPLG